MIKLNQQKVLHLLYILLPGFIYLKYRCSILTSPELAASGRNHIKRSFFFYFFFSSFFFLNKVLF